MTWADNNRMWIHVVATAAISLWVSATHADMPASGEFVGQSSVSIQRTSEVKRAEAYPGSPIILAAKLLGEDKPMSRDALFDDADDAPASASAKQGGEQAESSKAAVAKEESTKEASGLFSGLKGFVQIELARGIDKPSHWAKMLTRAELGAQGSMGSGIKWKMGARFDYDAVYSLFYDRYPADVVQDQKSNLVLRENYIDIGAGDWDFRLGRQQVVWGEMVGVFVADVVSAQDTREFILPAFDITRIPQWAARAEYFKNDFHAELLWVPVASFNESGKPGADFFPAPPPPPNGYNTEFRSEVWPSQSASNTNYGLRLSTLQNGWDVSGFYYRSMQASPTFYREIAAMPQTFIYEARHVPIQQLGGTVAKDLGSMVFKGEAVYTRGGQFNVQRLTDIDGVVPQNTLDWAAGLDFTFPGDARLNLQLFQRVFFGHDADIIPDKFESGMSVLLNRKFTSRLEGEVLLLSSLNRVDWLFRPRISWAVEKNLKFAVGADIFNGPPLGYFGRYTNQDRVYSELRFSF